LGSRSGQKTASTSFFEKKEVKKLHPFGFGAAATGEAHTLLIATPKVGRWAPPGIGVSEPKRTKVLFASFSFRKKKILACFLYR
jgi:hypothetical protein